MSCIYKTETQFRSACYLMLDNRDSPCFSQIHNPIQSSQLFYIAPSVFAHKFVPITCSPAHLFEELIVSITYVYR